MITLFYMWRQWFTGPSLTGCSYIPMWPDVCCLCSKSNWARELEGPYGYNKRGSSPTYHTIPPIIYWYINFEIGIDPKLFVLTIGLPLAIWAQSLQSLMGQGKRIWAFPYMCLRWWSFVSRVAPHLFWIDFQVQAQVWRLEVQDWAWTLKINPRKEKKVKWGATLETKLHHFKHM